MAKHYIMARTPQGDTVFALDVIDEVVPFMQLRHVAGGSEKFAGLLELHGEAISVFRYCNQTTARLGSLILIARHRGERYGIIVDDVENVFPVDDEEIQHRNTGQGNSVELIPYRDQTHTVKQPSELITTGPEQTAVAMGA